MLTHTAICFGVRPDADAHCTANKNIFFFSNFSTLRPAAYTHCEVLWSSSWRLHTLRSPMQFFMTLTHTAKSYAVRHDADTHCEVLCSSFWCWHTLRSPMQFVITLTHTSKSYAVLSDTHCEVLCSSFWHTVRFAVSVDVIYL